jgi:hypothetical protein
VSESDEDEDTVSSPLISFLAHSLTSSLRLYVVEFNRKPKQTLIYDQPLHAHWKPRHGGGGSMVA